MKSAILFTFLGIFVLSANADPITTSVSCTIGGQTIVSSSACGGSNPGAASGNASVTYSISGNTLSLALISVTEITGGQQTDLISSAASLNLNVYSAGYIGTAYVQFNGQITEEDGIAQFQMTPGYSSAACGPYGNNCLKNAYPGTEPVRLLLGGGNLFNFYAETSSVIEDSVMALNVGAITGGLSFFEADGVTPLDITLAPEPGSIALAGLGLVFCVTGLLKRLKATLGSLSGSEAATQLNLSKIAPAIMVAFFSVASVTANADPLSTSVSCTTASQTVVSTSGCSGPNYSGTASATYSISGNTLSLDLATLASNPGGPPATETDVSSNASLMMNVYAANYVGAAYVVLAVAASPGGSTYGMESFVLFDTTPGFSTFCVGFHCTQTGPNCGGSPNPQSPPCQTTFAIELGGGNLFNVDARLTALVSIPLDVNNRFRRM